MEVHAGMDGGYSSDEDSWYAAKVQMPDGSKKAVDEKTQSMLYAMKRYVNRSMRITLTDGRVVVGTCICFDYQGNILMSNAEELSVRSKEDGSLDRNDWRNLGMIMVKMKHMAKCEAESRLEDPPLIQDMLR